MCLHQKVVYYIFYFSYINENTKCSTAYKRYNKQIPEFLHNRPNYLIDHCMKRLVYAEDVRSIALVDDSMGAFLVTSEMGKHNYHVYFRAPHDTEIPCCECLDWQRNYLPCKHLLAIIQNKKFTSWGWKNLPTAYKDSPFLTLDVDILFKPIDHILKRVDDAQQVCGAESFHDQEKETEEADIKQTMTAVLPKPVFPKRTAITRCCDLLSRIKSLVHECTNSTSLASLEKSLQSALQEFENNSNTDSGLALTAPDAGKTSMKRKKRTSNISKSTTSNPKKKARLSNLPSAKLKKIHPYNRRVGQHAAMMRKFYNKDLSLEKMETQSSSKDTQTIPFMPTPHTGFTPLITESSSITAKLLRNGPHSVSLLEIKSLEPFLHRETQILLSSMSEKPFIPGWLYDEVINSFFWCLQEDHEHVLYAASTSMLSLQNGGQGGRLWSEKSNEKNLIIAPWNPTHCHWTLIAIDLQQRNIFYVDPLNAADDIKNKAQMQIIAKFIPLIIENKFGLSEFQISSPPHTLQQDTSSCGVFVCWYASQFVQGKSMSDGCDPYKMRVRIYNKIRGTCLKQHSQQPELSKCPLCGAPVFEENLKCIRCCQSYHILCIDSENHPTTRNPHFYCPP